VSAATIFETFGDALALERCVFHVVVSVQQEQFSVRNISAARAIFSKKDQCSKERFLVRSTSTARLMFSKKDQYSKG
jgi:hypothetical protein